MKDSAHVFGGNTDGSTWFGTEVKMANRRIALVVSALALATMGVAQSSKHLGQQGMPPEAELAMNRASDLMIDCHRLRGLKLLDLAEGTCRAAIQVPEAAGWKAAREHATLGMILFERGLKQEGFEVLLTSFDGYHGSDEREIFLGLAAAELGKWDVAKKVVEYYRHPRHSAGGADTTTRGYWPEGDSPQILRATLEFLEGSRLNNANGAASSVPRFRKAHAICPDNLAINFALGVTLKRAGLKNDAAPLLKLVVERATGRLQRLARIEYDQIGN